MLGKIKRFLKIIPNLKMLSVKEEELKEID
jgi:hypothetical protein